MAKATDPRTRSLLSPHMLWPPRPDNFYPFAKARPAALKLVADGADLQYLVDFHNAVGADDKTIYIARPYSLCKQIEDSLPTSMSD